MQVVLDFETRSEADLKSLGAYEYARHPSTEIICAGYKIDETPAKIWLPKMGGDKLVDVLLKADQIVVHNKIFEDVITRFVLAKYTDARFEIPHEAWRCSAAKAAMHGLPRDLERASRVLNLATQKDMEGNRLIKKYMKPRTVWKKWRVALDLGEAHDWEEPKKYFDDPDEIEKIYKYCLTDVETEYLLDKALTDLPITEREIWRLNQNMNLRGVAVDVDTSRLILDMIDKLQKDLTSELYDITGGAVDSAQKRAKFLAWAAAQGHEMKTLTADAVKEELKVLKKGPVKRALEIRQALSKSSTKKYEMLLKRAGSDGRVRDLAMYHGAHTGRDSGTGLQVHNLPKGKIKNTDEAIEVVALGDIKLIELLYGDPFSVFSSVIRGMITASHNHVMYAADFNAIEARVVNYLAGETSVLDDFKNGTDLYVKMAKRVGSESRAYGKCVELACGFSMGADKLRQTSIAWGVNEGRGITDEEADIAVKAYRASHPNVVKFWHQTERAAIRAARSAGERVKLKNGLEWYLEGRFLKCRLPSGRSLHYFGPEVRRELTPWAEIRPRLYHWHIDSLTKQWICSPTYGGKLCIAEGTKVLTHLRGWINIEQVLQTDLVWDGVDWVEHGGLKFNGVKKVIWAYGAQFTPDHLILTESGWRDASSSKRYKRAPCGIPKGFELSWIKRAQIALENRVHMWAPYYFTRRRDVETEKKRSESIVRMQKEKEHISIKQHPRIIRPSGVLGLAEYARSVSFTISPSVGKLRSERYTSLQKMAKIVCKFLGGYGRRISERFNFRSDRQRWGLYSEQLPMDHIQSASKQSPQFKKVYDLINCGPLNRFTVWAGGAPLLVHNCENIVQAVARDIMFEAALRIERHGYKYLMSIHDEIVAESKNGDLKEYESLLNVVPAWAPGLPVLAKGWSGFRFKKS